jgi:hypothetical protein
MKAKRILIGVALVTGVAACGDAAAPLMPTAGPSMNGHTLGGGAREGDSTSTQSDTTSTQRGGHTLGGGA